jgi:hypothetical protein
MSTNDNKKNLHDMGDKKRRKATGSRGKFMDPGVIATGP